MDKRLTATDRTGIDKGGMKNIAVIGAGISGLAAAYLLSLLILLVARRKNRAL